MCSHHESTYFGLSEAAPGSDIILPCGLLCLCFPIYQMGLWELDFFFSLLVFLQISTLGKQKIEGKRVAQTNVPHKMP